MNEWDALVLRTKIGLEMMEELHQVIVPGGEEAEIFGRELARRTTPEKLAERRERTKVVSEGLRADKVQVVNGFRNVTEERWVVPNGATVIWTDEEHGEVLRITYEDARRLSDWKTNCGKYEWTTKDNVNIYSVPEGSDVIWLDNNEDVVRHLPYSDHPYLAMATEEQLIRELKARELYTILDNGSVSVYNLIPKIVDVEQDLHDERTTESSLNRERWQNVIKKED